MSVEVRNLQTGETFEVGADGAVFGREGGQANIQVQDRSVSKRHARVFTDGVDWFLEDMGSVNGTVVDGAKIGAAVPLYAGLIFSLSKHKFEVTSVPGGDNGRSSPEQETRTAMRQAGNQNLPSELRKDPIPRKRSRDARPPDPYDDDIAPPTANESMGRNNLPLASDGDFPSESMQSMSRGVADDGGAPPGLGIDDYEPLTPGEAIGAGIGTTMKLAPLMALNPIGTVRNQLETQPLPGLEKVPLAMVLLPTYVVMLTLQNGVGAISTAVAGNLSIVSIILAPVIGIVVGVISALIAGFLGHPILAWIVDKLGGTSDARSRTNHMAVGMVAVFVAAIPTMLATFLTALIARLSQVSSAFALLQILPALLMLIATPLPIYVQWQWWKSYGIAKWAQTVLMVLTVLSLLGGVAGCVTTIIGAVRMMSGGGAAVVATDGGDTPTAGDGDTGAPTADGDANNAAAGTAAAAGTGTGTGTGDKPPATAAKASPDKVPDATPDKPSEPVRTTAATAIRIDDDYAVYAKQLADIEALLERDPTLIKNTSVRSKYETILERTDDAEGQVFNDFGGRKRRSYMNPVYDKAKKALVYERTKVYVKQLHELLFR